jgi:hypothetical protein
MRVVVGLLALFVAWSAAAAPVGAGFDDVGRVVRVGVEPEHLIAGEAADAWITVDVTGADGAALDVGVPLLTTSTGRVEAATRTGPGHFRARFTPPTEAYPHVAIVTAVVDDGGATGVGFTGVRLWG